jgi:hypothetical protein
VRCALFGRYEEKTGRDVDIEFRPLLTDDVEKGLVIIGAP